MKAQAAFAIAVIALSSPASAQTRVITAHAETGMALKCLLDHRTACSPIFVANARLVARPWLLWSASKDFALGALVSSDYAGTESVNAYLTKFLNGRVADVYHVKFRHEEKTFYIVPPGPDSRIHYMQIRNGGPNDEREEMFITGPG